MKTESGLPDALVIGPMKAGTTWIHDYLAARGDVALPRSVKETFFFDRYWNRGLSWYSRRFPRDRNRYQRTVEVAPSYFHHAKIPERVRAVLGDIPLVVTLRDPVRRAWSHYLHLCRYGYTRESLRLATETFPSILEASRYRTCLERWTAVFPPDRIYFVWQEQLAQAPEEYAQAVCEGLRIAYRSVSASMEERSNSAALPSSPWLAALGDRGAHALRGIGLYGAVNLAKRMGLKRFFFGRPGAEGSDEPAVEDREWLEAKLEGEDVGNGKTQKLMRKHW